MFSFGILKCEEKCQKLNQSSYFSNLKDATAKQCYEHFQRDDSQLVNLLK